MKKIRFIALALAIITVICAFASCANKETEKSTSKEEEKTKEPAKQFTVCDVVFDGTSDSIDERFEVVKEGNVSLDNQALEVTGYGSYALDDKNLVLTNDDYEYIKIKFDLKFSKLPTSGTPSIVAPLYYLDSLKGAENEEGKVNETGIIYQFFIKVDSAGKIAYYNKNWIGGYYKDSNDQEYKIEVNKTYKMEILYDNLAGSYTLSVNGEELKGAGNIVTVFEPDNTYRALYRFFDNNESVDFDAKIDNLFIEAIPLQD